MSRLVQNVSAFWLTRALTSTIGRKVLMALTGLGLCGFLVMHLSGNLLLYKGAEAYNEYAHALHAQQALLVVAEIGLLLLFLIHLWLALTTNRDNNAARPIDYEVKQTKQRHSALVVPPYSVMFASGVVVLIFLGVHLADLRFHEELADWNLRAPLPGSPAEQTMAVLRDPISAVVYFVGSLVLGYHVLHGFQSAFQSLGINHPKYTPAIKLLGLAFAVTVAVGFASFPLWAWIVKS